ncbi:MAG: phosphatase PAP2 family protein, partial [Candidatus Gastranaerophilales bacterium]|nr:phosphatase PAP2 family protein [Candidatus Gastranaerophilales bacterium]
CIYRPWMLDGRVKPLAAAIPAATGYSFPSGHTASCTAVYGSLIVWFRKNKIIRYLSFLIILLVMFSRNYLGVHTPQDVIVSFIIGIIILYANKKLLDWENKTKNADVIITAVITLVSVLLILYVNYKSYPMDYSGGKLLYNPAPIKTEIFARIGFVYGVFYGWLIEKRLVGFTPQSGSKLNKLLRFVVGLGCLTILLKFSELVLVDILGQRFGLFSGYFIIGLFITFFYPFLCKHVHSR